MSVKHKVELDNYAGQFSLARSSPDFDGQEINFAGWEGIFDESYSVVRIENEQGEDVGLLIGFPITEKEGLLSAGKINARITDPESFEDFLREVKGRYLAIFNYGGDLKLYPDPLATIPVVFSSEFQRVGSSPYMILEDDYFQYYDSDLAESLNMPESGLYYPAGLTPHKSVRRLLPNHYLDLKTFETKRYWEPSQEEINSIDKCIDVIIQEVSTVVRALHNHSNVVLSLTAGRDSRMLLASIKSFWEQLDFFVFVNNYLEDVDEYGSRWMENKFDLNVKYLKKRKSTENERERWLLRVGHAVSGGIMKIYPTLEEISNYDFIVTGIGGEIARSYFQEPFEQIDGLDANKLCSKLEIPATKRIVNRIKDWLDEVNEFDESTILDLAYMEMRVGCWGSPQILGNEKYAHHIYPFSNRKVIEAMFSFPHDYKAKQKLPEEICGKVENRLLELPFNEFPFYKKWKSFANKLPYIYNKISNWFLLKQ